MIQTKTCGLVLLIFVFLLSGCATVVHGRSEHLVIATIPPGAHVSMGGVERGVSPVTLSVRRNEKDPVIRIEAAGYETKEIVLRRNVSGWIAGDALMGAGQFLNQGLSSTSQRAKAALAVLGITLGMDFLTGGAFTHRHSVTAPVVLRPNSPR